MPSKPVDEEEEPVDNDSRSLVRSMPSIAHHSIMYAPKCLVLVSRLDYIETFRVCKISDIGIDCIYFLKEKKDNI